MIEFQVGLFFPSSRASYVLWFLITSSWREKGGKKSVISIIMAPCNLHAQSKAVQLIQQWNDSYSLFLVINQDKLNEGHGKQGDGSRYWLHFCTVFNFHPFEGSQRDRKQQPPDFLASYRSPSLKHYVSHYEWGMVRKGVECWAFLGFRKQTIGDQPRLLNSDSILCGWR